MTAIAQRTARAIALTTLILSLLGACSSPPVRATCPATQAGATPPRTATVSVADPGFLAAYAATFRFRLGHPRSFAWLPDGSRLYYLRSPARSFVQRLYVFDPATGKETLALTAEQLLAGAAETLSPEEQARRERQRQAARGITSYRLSKDGRTLLIPLSGRIFLWDPITTKSRELQLPGAGAVLDPRLSPDGTQVAWVRGGALWAMALNGGAAVRLTPPGTKELQFGLAEFVAQEEMARHHGYWWSPDGRAIAFQRTDTSAVERMHIHDPLHPDKPGRSWPYPRPGKTNAAVRLGVVAAAGGKLRWLDWDHKRWPYLTRVRWQKSAPLTVVVQNRTQTELAVLSVVAPLKRPKKPAEWQTLLTERDTTWLNLDPAMPRWLPDGRRFLWTTERAGSWQLELHDLSGKLDRVLTQPAFGYHGLVSLDADGEAVTLLASTEASEQHIYRLRLSPTSQPRPPERLTATPGWHGAVVAKSGDAWLLELGPTNAPSRVEVGGRQRPSPHILPHEAESPGFPVQPRFLTVGPRKVRAAVLMPRNAKLGQRFPVILHVYGGPHYNVVRATQSRWAMQQWLADHGYVVCSFDGRGTPWRGRAWERATKGDLLSAPLADQVEALRILGAQLPAMDTSRVGVFGWSFGGTFSAAAVMRYPGVFKAAVAGAPVTDWLGYDTHYTERYLGLPAAAPQAYKISSPLTSATQLKRPLMLIHGTADDNVWFSQSVKLSKALFDAGIQHDFVPLPGHTHMVRDRKTLERMYERILGFFGQHL